MKVANLVAFLLYLFMMIMPLGEIFNAYTAVQNALGAVIRIREITALAEEENDADHHGAAATGPIAAATARTGRLCWSSTGSASATRDTPVLRRGELSRCRPAAGPRSSDRPGPASRPSWR